MTSVDVSTEVAEPPDWLPDTQDMASRILAAIGVTSYSLSVVLCDDARITEVNNQYRGVDDATDVLTFSQNEGDLIPGSKESTVSGDIMISLESVSSNAEQFGVDSKTEFMRVLTHGILHLAGHTHEGVTLADAAASTHPMLALQEEIVATLKKEQDE